MLLANPEQALWNWVKNRSKITVYPNIYTKFNNSL